jgi:hypothetical protein
VCVCVWGGQTREKKLLFSKSINIESYNENLFVIIYVKHWEKITKRYLCTFCYEICMKWKSWTPLFIYRPFSTDYTHTRARVIISTLSFLIPLVYYINLTYCKNAEKEEESVIEQRQLWKHIESSLICMYLLFRFWIKKSFRLVLIFLFSCIWNGHAFWEISETSSWVK